MMQETTFSAARQYVLAQYGAAVESPGEALFVVVCDSACDSACLDALVKTAERLGYGQDNVSQVVVDAQDCPLSDESLFELVEGLDPVCVCVVGSKAVALFCRAYRIARHDFVHVTALGRPVCLMAGLPQLLGTDQGRQQAWGLLKTLPAAAS